MTVKELIAELSKVDQNLNVMAAGEYAEKVVVEECKGNKYIRIFQPWDVVFTGTKEVMCD